MNDKLNKGQYLEKVPRLDRPEEQPRDPAIDAALSRIPSGLFVFTSAHDGRKSGVLVRWVQPCSLTPPMVMLSVEKGHHVAPLVTESKAFALSQLARDDQLTVRKFELLAMEEEGTLIEVGTRTAPSGAPIIDKAVAWIDCELVRHLDIDSDFELFVGMIRHAGVLSEDEPHVSFNDLRIMH